MKALKAGQKTTRTCTDMKYCYDLFQNGKRIGTGCDFDILLREATADDFHIIATNNINGHVTKIEGIDGVEDWRMSRERDIWLDVANKHDWKPFEEAEIHMKEKSVPDHIAKAVSPSHYKGYVDDYQWLDVMSRIPSMREPARFKAAVELQVRKYLDRCGQKDEELQELKKSLFYLKYLVAYVENGNSPIVIEDVPGL